jgi:hypothetical protein
MAAPPPDVFWLDEEPLRKAILKGYFAEKDVPLDPEPLIAHLRDLLSGAPGADTVPEVYFFEEDPEETIPAFLRGIDRESPGLANLVAEPLIAAAEDLVSGKRKEIAPNTAVFISSLAGSIAVKADVSEAVAGALLAGFLLAVERLGPRKVRDLVTSSRI